MVKMKTTLVNIFRIIGNLFYLLIIVRFIIVCYHYNCIIINNYIDGESVDDITDKIMEATGRSGTNKAYVTALAQGLRNLDIGENKAKHVFEIEKAVKKKQKGIMKFHYFNRNLNF